MVTRQHQLDALKYVTEHAEHVYINEDKIASALPKIKLQPSGDWASQAGLSYQVYDEEALMRYFIIRESFNFCFWDSTPKWRIEYRDKWYSGSYGMIYAIEKARLSGQDLTNFEFAKQLSLEDFKAIFKGTTDIPLAKERYEIFRTLMDELEQAGELRKLFSVENDEALLNRIIENFSNFRDTSIYHGKEVHFYKRAILLVTDLVTHLDFIKEKIKDDDNMFGCADYKAPQSLRQLGILEYGPALAEKIDSQTLLEADSNEEIEIRAATLIAIEKIKGEFIKQGRNINSVQIDNALWLLSKRPNFTTKPYHLTRTTNY